MDIEQIASLAPLDADLGSWAPKPTAVTEGVMERSLTIWEGPGVDVGLWECTPGTFSARRDTYTESCVILAGHVTLEDSHGSMEYRAGMRSSLRRAGSGSGMCTRLCARST